MKEDRPHNAPDELIVRYLADEHSPEEGHALDLWIAESPRHERYFNEMKLSWKILGELKAEALGQIDAAWERQLDRQDQEKITRIQPMRSTPRWYSFAAVLLIGFLLVGGWYWFSNSSIPQNSTYELAYAAGYENKYELADGSTVHLRNGASLEIPTQFDQEKRLVSLKGEAFFDISRDEKRPFEIETEHSRISVLGTSFLVKTDSILAQTEVLVSTGTVKLESKQNPKNKGLILNAGSMARHRIKEDIIDKVSDVPDNLDSWASKRFRFIRTPITKVVQTLSEAYQKDISISGDAVLNCKYSGTFEGMDLETIMEILAATNPYTVQKDGDQYIISGLACQ